MRKGASGGKPQPRHVGSDEGRVRAYHNAGTRDENTVPVG